MQKVLFEYENLFKSDSYVNKMRDQMKLFKNICLASHLQYMEKVLKFNVGLKI